MHFAPITHLFFYCLILFPLINNTLQWNYNQNGLDWPNTCKVGEQSPIDITSPFTYNPLEINFHYEEMPTEYLLYHDINNLILEGDFGYLTLNQRIYPSSHLLFFSPSLHSFKGKKYPLEMQVVHQSPEGNKVTICVMFKESKEDYSLILGKLGFDEKDMQNLSPLNKKTIKSKINLSKYISNDKEFFSYESFEPVPPCDKMDLIYILSDILNVNTEQINNFPIMVKNKFRSPQLRLERNIYITIPVEQFAEKIAQNRKAIAENDAKIAKNEKLDSIAETHSEGEENSEAPDSDIISEDEMSIMIPFKTVKQKVLAGEKYNKKTDVKLLSSKNLNPNKTMIIDKDIPQSQGEIERDILKEKYATWREIYNNLTEGIMVYNEQLRAVMMFQMNSIEKELKDKKYQPYIDFISVLNSKNYYSNSFIEIESNSINKEIEDIIDKYIKDEEDNSPYKIKNKNKDDIGNAKGEKAIYDKEINTSTIFDVTTWPLDCKVAELRSPVNINLNNSQILSNSILKFHLSKPIGKIYINNDNYKIVIFSDGGFGTIEYYEHEYTAQKIALHLPSEHTFSLKEERMPFEMQIICNDIFGNIAAISVLFTIGESFKFLKTIGLDDNNNNLLWKKIRNNIRVEIENTEYIQNELDLSYMFNDNKNNKFIHYIGTTTTPSCKTNVKWFVSVNMFTIAQKQIEMFPVLYGRYSNVRGIQDLNDRHFVYMS